MKCKRDCFCQVGGICKYQDFSPLTEKQEKMLGCNHPLIKGGV